MVGADDAYAKNKAWGEQKEHEAADILEKIYPELMVRRTDITGKVIPYEKMRMIPSQPNLQIFHPGNQQQPPITMWCESTRRTLPALKYYFNSLFIKLKTFKAMREDHYLLKPCVGFDDAINDIIAIKKIDMVYVDSVSQAAMPGPGRGWNARVDVRRFGNLYENRQRTADTFLEALLNPITTAPTTATAQQNSKAAQLLDW